MLTRLCILQVLLPWAMFVPADAFVARNLNTGWSTPAVKQQNRKSRGLFKSEALPWNDRWTGLWNNRQEESIGPDPKINNTSSSSSSYHWVSPEQLERLRDSVSIVDVVASYNLPGFQITSSHNNDKAVAICPFHNDHHPSLHMDRGRKLFKCFACGAGGDVFSFVRQYDGLGKSGANRMSFAQSVWHVAKEFGDSTLQAELGSSLDGSSSSRGGSRMTQEQRQERLAKQNRLWLANTMAAEFYGKCLVTLPAAGAARRHLRERKLSPSTVRAFAMGYAPNAYFQPNQEWGQGSLVFHLRDKGFRPQELIDSGLATRTKRGQWRDVVVENSTNATVAEMEDTDFSTLMDRFRGRLMIPIFDSTGTHVIGFGGRILGEDNQEADFKPPKYLNSPETLVFHKKDELFGLHCARKAIQSQEKTPPDLAGRDRSSIVIVEGYMDAIALWDSGVEEVVASMGTALTMEQLSAAAKIVGAQGRVVLCLDNDEAGVNAMERLCGGSVLGKVAEKSVVEILVGTLPKGIKDPAEFVASKVNRSKSSAGEVFREDVMDASLDWTVWYINLLLSRYDHRALRGSAGSFGDVCDRISEFLSTFPNPADRTQRAHIVAGVLAETMAKNSKSGMVSSALRIQLESDLVNMVARKASARLSVQRRIESVDGISPKETKDTMTRLGKGEALSTSENDESKLSLRALRAAKPPKSSEMSDRQGLRAQNSVVTTSGRGKASDRRGQRQRLRRASRKLVERPLTPHFSGFDFANKSDADWLGIPRQGWKGRTKKNMSLGKKLDLTDSLKPWKTEGVNGELIYFNSNLYHGGEFITEDAMEAGYTSGDAPRDASLLQNGVASLIVQDPDGIVLAAEDKLLRCLVEHSSAREAMKTAMLTSDATGARGKIEWSRYDREWLFTCLVDRLHTAPEDVLAEGNTIGLRGYLAGLPDAPHGAFGLKRKTSSSATGSEDDSGASLELKRESGWMPTQNDHEGADDSNVPSDVKDIEEWASSYKPHEFDPERASSTDTVDGVTSNQAVSYGPDSMDVSSFSPGTLDKYFAREADVFALTYDDSVSRQLRAELEVQESLATLLKVSTLKQLASVKSEFFSATRILNMRLEDPVDLEASRSETSLVSFENDRMRELDSIPTEDLKDYCDSVARKLRDLSETAHHLHQSAKRIETRLLDYSNADGLEGRVSVALQDQLAAAVDEHVENLPEIWRNETVGDKTLLDRRFLYMGDPSIGWMDTYEGSEDAFENDMTRIEAEWGDWCSDDFKWSPDDIGAVRCTRIEGNAVDFPVAFDDLSEEESLEDAMSRIDVEWGDWSSDDFTSLVRGTSTPAALDEDVDFSEYLQSEGIASDGANVGNDEATSGRKETKQDVDFDSIFE